MMQRVINLNDFRIWIWIEIKRIKIYILSKRNFNHILRFNWFKINIYCLPHNFRSSHQCGRRKDGHSEAIPISHKLSCIFQDLVMALRLLEVRWKVTGRDHIDPSQKRRNICSQASLPVPVNILFVLL